MLDDLRYAVRQLVKIRALPSIVHIRARARHRSEHCDLQRDQRSVAATAAVSGCAAN